jgi:hypothetical protein
MDSFNSIKLAASKSFQSRILEMIGIKTVSRIKMTDIATKGFFVNTDKS